jgi:hypothetical protein
MVSELLAIALCKVVGGWRRAGALFSKNPQERRVLGAFVIYIYIERERERKKHAERQIRYRIYENMHICATCR